MRGTAERLNASTCSAAPARGGSRTTDPNALEFGKVQRAAIEVPMLDTDCPARPAATPQPRRGKLPPHRPPRRQGEGSKPGKQVRRRPATANGLLDGFEQRRLAIFGGLQKAPPGESHRDAREHDSGRARLVNALRSQARDRLPRQASSCSIANDVSASISLSRPAGHALHLDIDAAVEQRQLDLGDPLGMKHPGEQFP